MPDLFNKRILIPAAVVVVAIIAVIVLIGSSSSDVTKARLERNLPVAFSKCLCAAGQAARTRRHHAPRLCTPRLVRQGRPQRARPRARSGLDLPDVVGLTRTCRCPMAPGSSAQRPLQRLLHRGWPVQVRRTADYQRTLEGKDVDNPVFEFDSCFDPHTSNRPTGVVYPSLLAIASTTITPDGNGTAGLQVTCGSGDQGCAGTITVAAGDTKLGTIPFDLEEESTATLPLPAAAPPSARELTFTVHTTTGAGPTSPSTLPVCRPSAGRPARSRSCSASSSTRSAGSVSGRFLHALNYCMLLPGPEAQQLAIYIGWLLNGTLGG